MIRIVFFALSVGLACLNAHLCAEIVETNDLSDVLAHAREGSLYVFDLDNTLIAPRQHLGSDQWVSYAVDRFVKQGLTLKEALDRVIPCYVEVIKKTEMELIDPQVPAIFRQLEQKHIPYIGLTKRDPLIAERTLEQLETLKVHFSPFLASEMDDLLEGMEGTLYKKGVLFAAQSVEKGPTLCAYLKGVKKRPSQIVAIDDKLSHLKSLSAAAEGMGIPFVGVRYGGADEKVRNFNPQIADMQLEHFEKILSDEEALKLLEAKSSKGRVSLGGSGVPLP